jgi:hypothetical protein
MQENNNATFKKADYTLSGLLQYIDMGDLALPDIQRPFVWKPTQVRDLFDSMYKGFPIGHLLFWANEGEKGSKQIGVDGKTHTPKYLIIDGQQRLTSLYSVFKGKEIIDENYRKRKIEIAFRPRDGKFDVADAAIKRDPEFIPDISGIWTSGSSSRKIGNDFIGNLKTKKEITEEEEEIISRNLDRLFDLGQYPFTALEIFPNVDEEQVSDIFVRTNSGGVKLGQADFILTLLSVFWDEGRAELEKFARLSTSAPDSQTGPSPFNHFIEATPDQMLRVAIALAFRRGRLKSVYHVLRGKDPETEKYDPDLRDLKFSKLRTAQEKTLNLNNWHQFFNALIGSGFRSGKLVSSKNSLLFSYIFYLIGKEEYGIKNFELERLIGRWFFATSLSGRYTSSPETTLDGDLRRLHNIESKEAFTEILDSIIANTLTQDFWNISIPESLATSSATSPVFYAFVASQIKLSAPILFSVRKVSDLLDPAIVSKRKPLEKHHLHPKAWLIKNGITETSDHNQIANFTFLEWGDNKDISDKPPSEYVPIMKSRFSDQEYRNMCYLHALPEDWENLEYSDFLEKRRKLMGQIIKEGYNSL